jgi:peptide/nickel transport system permease protein
MVFAAPVFWLGQLLLLALAVMIPIFPVGGMSSLREAPADPIGDVLWHLVLPATCLSAGFLALLARVLRNSVLIEIRRECAGCPGAGRLAHAGGVGACPPQRAGTRHHARRPSDRKPAHRGGPRGVVFGWPGIGRLLLDASASRDYPLVIAVLLVVSLVVVMANVITDALYVVADPRLET